MIVDSNLPWYWCRSCNVHGRGTCCWSCGSKRIQTGTAELTTLEVWDSMSRDRRVVT